MNLPDAQLLQPGNRHRFSNVDATAKRFNMTAGRPKP